MPRTNDELILTELRDMRKELGDHRTAIEPYIRQIPVHTEQIENMKKEIVDIKEKPVRELKKLQLLLATIISAASVIGIILTLINYIGKGGGK